MGDVATDTQDTSRVEGTHGELGSGLANGLRGNSPHRFAQVNDFSACKICPIALLADAFLRHARHRGTNDHVRNTRRLYSFRIFVRKKKPSLPCGAARFHFFRQDPTDDEFRNVRFDAGRTHCVNGDTAFHSAIRFHDDNILRDVKQSARQIPRVRGLQSRVGESLPGAVRRGEVFYRREAFHHA